MDVEYKSLRIKLSSWRKLRRAFYGRKDETFSDYIERIAKVFDDAKYWEKRIKWCNEDKELKNEK